MEQGKMTFDETQIASLLRQEILKNSQSLVEANPRQKDLSGIEYISTQKQPYISPIMTMNENEILDFVEQFEASELATLSVAELNRIGEVLGVDPSLVNLSELEDKQG